MSYVKQGGGGKRDAAEPAIVAALRELGCTVRYLSGKGNPDLLVRRPLHRWWTPLEVKSGTAGYTKNQNPDDWATVRTPAQAIEEVFG